MNIIKILNQDLEKVLEVKGEGIYIKIKDGIQCICKDTSWGHFDSEMIADLRQNHEIHFITLHVGAGTFKPVEVADLRDHKMHGELYSIPPQTAQILKSERKILGVGTTVTRTIENFARNGQSSGICELFLHPGNPPIRQNFLLTNFHLPKSTLIMLVASFIGLERTLELYRIAVEQRYRFYSYGDGMLVL